MSPHSLRSGQALSTFAALSVNSAKGLSRSAARCFATLSMTGLAPSIVKDGEVLLSQGFGKRNVAEHLEVTPHMLFAIGSASKAFTAMTLAILVDEGSWTGIHLSNGTKPIVFIRAST